MTKHISFHISYDAENGTSTNISFSKDYQNALDVTWVELMNGFTKILLADGYVLEDGETVVFDGYEWHRENTA